MNVEVTFYSVSRELAGTPKVTLSLPTGATLSDAVTELQAQFPALLQIRDVTLYAIGLEYAVPESPLTEGAEIAIIPPVQGG